MSTLLSKDRVGSFTASDIHKLMSKDKAGTGFGKPAFTYIKQKQYERKLGRSITVNTNSRPTSWGKLNELRSFEMLGTEYSINSDETLKHPTIPNLSGTPDGFKHQTPKAVMDFKCPFTLLSFCEFVEPIYTGLKGMDAMNYLRKNHDSGEAYFWQLVCNSMITGCTHAELIIYCPYERELDEIRIMAMDAPPEIASDYNWLNYVGNSELPYLIEGGFYKNINTIRFEIPQDDIDALTAAVLKANELLIKP